MALARLHGCIASYQKLISRFKYFIKDNLAIMGCSNDFPGTIRLFIYLKKSFLTLCMLGIFHAFLSSAYFFQNEMF